MQSHNLDLSTYSLPELLDLFDLTRQPTLQDMARAKRKMLMVHPDKSRLPPSYFLFYQKAYNKIVEFYNQQNRQSQPVENRDYEAPEVAQPHVKEAAQHHFDNHRFNNLFEQNGGIDKSRQETQKQRFGWFSQADGPPDVREEVIQQQQKQVRSAKQINDAFETIRPRVVQSMVVHQEIRPLSFSNGAQSYFDEDDDESEQNNGYISAEIFSKLKFDDIRRVHKDETILPVGETDFQKVKTFGSVEEYQQFRGQQSNHEAFMKKEEAESFLQAQERAKQQQFEQRWSKSQQRTHQYEQQNQRVLSQFMMLSSAPSPTHK